MERGRKRGSRIEEEPEEPRAPDAAWVGVGRHLSMTAVAAATASATARARAGSNLVPVPGMSLGSYLIVIS